MGSGGKKQSPGAAALLDSKYLAHNRVNLFSVKDVIAPYGSSQGLFYFPIWKLWKGPILMQKIKN